MNEAENKDRLQRVLEAHFELMPEVWLREPITGMACRIDFLATTGDVLPWDVFGVEVKRSDLEGGQRRHALAQCIAYRRCVVVDKRLPGLRGRYLPVVALYFGGRSHRDERRYGVGLRNGPVDAHAYYGEVRLAGIQNVGVFVHGSAGLALEVSDERLWTERYGVSGVGVNWPAERIFANGTKRAV